MQEKQSIILGELSFIRYENLIGTSLVVHWVRIHLPVQGHRFHPRFRKISVTWSN